LSFVALLLLTFFSIASCSSYSNKEATVSDSNYTPSSSKVIHNIGFGLSERIDGFPLFGTIAVNNFSVKEPSFNNKRITFYEIADDVIDSMPWNSASGIVNGAEIYDTNHYWEQPVTDMLSKTMVGFLDRIGAADEIVPSYALRVNPEFILDAEVNKFYIIAISDEIKEHPESKTHKIYDENYKAEHPLLDTRQIPDVLAHDDAKYLIVLEMSISINDTAENTVVLANTYHEKVKVTNGNLNTAIDAVSEATRAIYQHFATDLMGKLS
jgi:hypothetical protein